MREKVKKGFFVAHSSRVKDCCESLKDYRKNRCTVVETGLISWRVSGALVCIHKDRRSLERNACLKRVRWTIEELNRSFRRTWRVENARLPIHGDTRTGIKFRPTGPAGGQLCTRAVAFRNSGNEMPNDNRCRPVFNIRIVNFDCTCFQILQQFYANNERQRIWSTSPLLPNCATRRNFLNERLSLDTGFDNREIGTFFCQFRNFRFAQLKSYRYD